MRAKNKVLSALLAVAVLVTSFTVFPTQKAKAAIPSFEEAVIIAHGVNMRLRRPWIRPLC
jgi:hypothetical protein